MQPSESAERRSRAELLSWALADFRRFCGLLQIQPKGGGGRIRFNLSPIQRQYDAARTPRDIILKPRQVYITTLEAARDLWFFLTRPGARVVVVCQSQTDGAPFKDISEKFRLFIDSLARAGLKLEFGRESFGEWSLPARDSTMRIIQAGASEAAAAKKGRGGTVNRLHVTEAAFFERAETTFNSLLESVPGPEHGSEVVNESTPNGVGGFYHEQWEAAVRGLSGYKPHFFRWWEHPEYTLPLEADEVVKPETELEEKLVSLGVSPPQLKWYRRKLAEKGRALTAQEYPSDPDSCFLVSGRGFFEQEVTARLLAKATEPVEKRERDRVRIWRKPESGKLYILTLDTSEGVGGDPSGGILRERATGELAATIDGQYPPWELARTGAKLGREYNDAIIAVERNNHGHAALQALEREEKYKKIYKHADDKLGWPTNAVTRPQILDALEDAHRNGLWASPDRATLEQFRTFIVPATGKPEAAPGAHDDLVMAEAIAWAVRQLPVFKYGRLA